MCPFKTKCNRERVSFFGKSFEREKSKIAIEEEFDIINGVIYL